ncbi:unnamed protein product [Ambrosiozyma monospora]|uniref:Unnamed protein product n=1 Tax=Ambrosiozyma monospora TaxID=43982 RepID=A0ACB5SS51_AMBMO|nr:unnamed protein product [Ambrosiozyma monospora]
MTIPVLVSSSSASAILKSKAGKTGTMLMSANAKCADLSLAYGQCMVKNAKTGSKEACLNEFMAYKNCMKKSLSGSF